MHKVLFDQFAPHPLQPPAQHTCTATLNSTDAWGFSLDGIVADEKYTPSEGFLIDKGRRWFRKC